MTTSDAAVSGPGRLDTPARRHRLSIASASPPQIGRVMQGVRPVVLAGLALGQHPLDSRVLIAASVYAALACVLNAWVPRQRALGIVAWTLLLVCDLCWLSAAVLHLGPTPTLVPLLYGAAVAVVIALTSRTLGLEIGILAITCYCAAAVMYSSILVKTLDERSIAYLISGVSLAGGLIGYVVNESRKLETSRMAHQRIHTLVMATEAMAAGEEGGSVWPSIASYAASVVEARRAWAVSIDPDTSELRVRAVHGPRATAHPPLLDPEDPGVTGEVAETGQGQLIADHAKRHPLLSRAERSLTEEHLIAAPISTTEATVGIILATRKGSTRAFTQDDLRVLTLLGRTIGFRMQNVRLIRALKQQATRDSLTGLLNHGSFLEEVQAQVAAARLSGQRLSLVMIDMDAFKQVNDQAGHAEGNRLLLRFSETLRSHFRATDTLGRCGGDEFAVLLPGVGCEEASQISRRAASTVRSLREVLQLPSRTSASWGIASFPDDARDADDLLRRADTRLYAAKRAGGDRVAFGDQGSAMLAHPLEPTTRALSEAS